MINFKHHMEDIHPCLLEYFEYLDSFDCFLLESQLNKYSTDFYQDEDRTLAISTTPFSYNNNIYILEHSCEKETSFSIYKSDKKILQSL